MFRKKNTGYVLKLSPQGPKMRFKSEKEANEYLAKLKEKNAKYATTKIKPSLITKWGEQP